MQQPREVRICFRYELQIRVRRTRVYGSTMFETIVLAGIWLEEFGVVSLLQNRGSKGL